MRWFEELRGLKLRENPCLSELYFTHSFVGGLSDQIKPLVRTLTPSTLGDAVEKAQLHEIALKASHRSYAS